MKAENSLSKNCHSTKTFTAEIALHFLGLEGLRKPIVWVFPDVSICLDSGRAEFQVPKRELEVLRTGKAVEGAAVSEGEKEEKGCENT